MTVQNPLISFTTVPLGWIKENKLMVLMTKVVGRGSGESTCPDAFLEHFIKYALLRGVWGYTPCVGSEVKSCGRKGF